MGYIYVLPPNTPALLERALKALSVMGNEILDIPGRPTCRNYLSQCVDLTNLLDATKRPPSWQGLGQLTTSRDVSNTDKVIDALERLLPTWTLQMSLTDLCSALPTISPRIFSIASVEAESSNKPHTVDTLVKVRPGGRFSDQFLTPITEGPVKLRYKIRGMQYFSLAETAITFINH